MIQIEPGPVSRPAKHGDFHASMWFRSQSFRYHELDLEAIDINKSHYRVCEYPVAELGSSLEEASEALIDLSYGEYWVGCSRKGVAIGDIIIYAGTAYVIVDKSDTRASFSPRSWTNLALIAVTLKQETQNEKWATP